MFYKMLLATSILALSPLVSVSLYPTQPIQDTVYYAGETALTTWIDDGISPLLSDMGRIVIQLYTSTDVRIPHFLSPSCVGKVRMFDGLRISYRRALARSLRTWTPSTDPARWIYPV